MTIQVQASDWAWSATWSRSPFSEQTVETDPFEVTVAGKRYRVKPTWAGVASSYLAARASAQDSVMRDLNALSTRSNRWIFDGMPRPQRSVPLRSLRHLQAAAAWYMPSPAFAPWLPRNTGCAWPGPSGGPGSAPAPWLGPSTAYQDSYTFNSITMPAWLCQEGAAGMGVGAGQYEDIAAFSSPSSDMYWRYGWLLGQSATFDSRPAHRYSVMRALLRCLMARSCMSEEGTARALDHPARIIRAPHRIQPETPGYAHQSLSDTELAALSGDSAFRPGAHTDLSALLAMSAHVWGVLSAEVEELEPDSYDEGIILGRPWRQDHAGEILIANRIRVRVRWPWRKWYKAEERPAWPRGAPPIDVGEYDTIGVAGPMIVRHKWRSFYDDGVLVKQVWRPGGWLTVYRGYTYVGPETEVCAVECESPNPEFEIVEGSYLVIDMSVYGYSGTYDLPVWPLDNPIMYPKRFYMHVGQVSGQVVETINTRGVPVTIGTIRATTPTDVWWRFSNLVNSTYGEYLRSKPGQRWYNCTIDIDAQNATPDQPISPDGTFRSGVTLPSHQQPVYAGLTVTPTGAEPKVLRIYGDDAADRAGWLARVQSLAGLPIIPVGEYTIVGPNPEYMPAIPSAEITVYPLVGAVADEAISI